MDLKLLIFKFGVKFEFDIFNHHFHHTYRKNKFYHFPLSHIVTIVQFDYISTIFGYLNIINGLLH
jgi:hypothetical protein